jgi:hypothetical protein
MDRTAPLPRRVGGYLAERFPLGPYSVLVVLFFGSGLEVAKALGATPDLRAWLGAPVVLLAFFHLRVFDEHKDHVGDALAHPERFLSRGVVDLPLLARLGGAAVLMEAALSWWVGPWALAAWLAVFLFTVLMRVEFGVGGWLRPRIVWYAVSHNPVVGLLGVYVWACAGGPYGTGLWCYVGLVSAASLAFEVGRKLRLPGQEQAGVQTYSAALGRDRAVELLRAAGMLGFTACFVTALALADTPIGAAITVLGGLVGLALLVLLSGADRPAKHVELGASLNLLISLAGTWIGLAWGGGS